MEINHLRLESENIDLSEHVRGFELVYLEPRSLHINVKCDKLMKAVLQGSNEIKLVSEHKETIYKYHKCKFVGAEIELHGENDTYLLQLVVDAIAEVHHFD